MGSKENGINFVHLPSSVTLDSSMMNLVSLLQQKLPQLQIKQVAICRFNDAQSYNAGVFTNTLWDRQNVTSQSFIQLNFFQHITPKICPY